jgi:hypothetical protein
MAIWYTVHYKLICVHAYICGGVLEFLMLTTKWFGENRGIAHLHTKLRTNYEGVSVSSFMFNLRKTSGDQ